ncbi:MAG: hypothetical protein ACE5R4_05800 [Armatimonadota bacterium]
MLCLLLPPLLAALPAAAEVRNIRVTTDRTVDSWDCQSIVESLSKFGMSDEERCIALWEYVFRSMFHHQTPKDFGPGEEGRPYTLDAIKLLNVYGFSLCTPYAVTLGSLFEAAGFPAEVVHFANGGHTIVQVQYDGSWHAFDPMMGWFVYTKEPRKIASLEDIKRDPSIMLDAAREGRASTPFVPCGDEPKWLAEGAETWKSYGPNSVNKPRHTMDYSLRPGETLTRQWDNEGVYWSPRTPADRLPVHSCPLRRDQACPQFALYWQPYVKELGGRPVCRYWSTSRLEYEPNLEGESFLQGVVRHNNLAYKAQDGKDPALRPAQAGQPASVVFSVASQYCLADVTLEVTTVRGDDDTIAVSVSTDGGTTWRALGKVEDTGEKQLKQKLTSLVGGHYGYWVRFDMQAQGATTDVGLSRLKFVNILMANMYSFPSLVAGDNHVTVRLDDPEQLAQDKVTVEYAWYEGDAVRTDRQEISESPYQYAVDVPGDGPPKMKHLLISVTER